MKFICAVLAVLSSLAFLLGFAGQAHPFLDALAIGRWVAILGALFFLCAFAALKRQYVLCILAGLALFGVGALSRISFDSEFGDVRVYTKNLLHNNSEVAAVTADIQTATPDIVILQEVSETNRAILTNLETILPYQARCPWQGWNGIAILSRWPLSDAGPRCSPERSLMAIEIMRPNDPFWAIGVHLQQPWPDVQWQHLERALPVLFDIDNGAIVAGDFNTVPWAAAAQKIGALTGTRHVGTTLTTFTLMGVGLPLDQVWALGGMARIRPALGSDHLGVVADVWPSQIQ